MGVLLAICIHKLIIEHPILIKSKISVGSTLTGDMLGVVGTNLSLV